MSSPDMLSENVEKIAALFPSCVTETAEGKAIDFDLLKQELNKDIIEGNKERYTLNWPGKKEAIVTANIPTTQTLRPVKEDSVNWDTTENLYIEGDNLEVLKILQESYLNKVKMIYIDPPYNTGTAMIYNNDFSLDKDIYQEMSGDIDKYGNRLKINNGTDGRLHSNWLSMMYTRIKLSSHLLKKDGFMVIAIDHYELHNLITICDNIFGESNRLGIVSMLHNPEGRQNAKYFTVTNEYFLVYSKSQQSKFNGVVLQENVKNSKDILKEYNLKDERGFYKEKSYMRKGGGDLSLRINKPNAWYPLYVSKDLNDISLNFHKGYEEIFPITDSGQERTWNLVKDSFKSKYNSGEIYAIKKDEKIQICEKYRNTDIWYKDKDTWKIKDFLIADWNWIEN